MQTVRLSRLASWSSDEAETASAVTPLCTSASAPNFLTALFKIGKHSMSNFILLCKHCFAYARSFTFSYKCWDQLVSFCKIPAGILIRIVLNL